MTSRPADKTDSPVTDRGVDQQADDDSTLARSIWDELRASVGQAPARLDGSGSERASGDSGTTDALAYDTHSLYYTGSADRAALAGTDAGEAKKPPAKPDPAEAAARDAAPPAPAAVDASTAGKPPGKPEPTEAGALDSPPPGDRATAPLPGDSYSGEVINRDVQPTTHQAGPGEDLERIAAQHLGTGATAEEIQRHAREIAQVNNISDPAQLHEGMKLSLPGHTASGGFVTQDKIGNRHTVWQNGTERVENVDRTGYVRQADGSEHHWGPRPADNYDRTSDGRLVQADRSAEGEAGQVRQTVVGAERQRLDQLAETAIQNPEERTRFRLDMEAFDRRARERQPPLAQEEIERTYHEVARLLETQGDQHVAQADRVRIAEQVMRHAADPTTVDQGAHNTCNVATIEARMYTRSPAEAARMVADVATTGQFRTADGAVVQPGNVSIRSANELQGEATRDHASQIFQTTAVNVHYAYNPARDLNANPVLDGSGNPVRGRYEQVTPVPGTTPATGEYLLDTRTGQPLAYAPQLWSSDFDDISYQISGRRESDFVLTNNPSDPGGAPFRVESEEDLRGTLARMQLEGRLPAIIEVHSQNEPFWGDSGHGAAGGSGGWHVVTVTDFDPATNRVSIDNQWGESHDHLGRGGVHTRELFRAMANPVAGGEESESIESLEATVAWNREHDRVSGFKELDLLRLRRDADMQTLTPEEVVSQQNRTPEEEAEYDREIVRVMSESQDRWRRRQSDGSWTPEEQRERDRTIGKYRAMLMALQPAPNATVSSQERSNAAARVAAIQQAAGIM